VVLKHELLVGGAYFTDRCPRFDSKCPIGRLQVVGAVTGLTLEEIDDDLDALFIKAEANSQAFQSSLLGWADSPIGERDIDRDSKQDQAVVSSEHADHQVGAVSCVKKAFSLGWGQ
jgi:hypothetical protein